MADGLLADPSMQAFWLKFICEEFDVPASNVSVTFGRWRAEGKPPIKSFLPYGYYCCRIRLFFILALLNDHFGGVTHEVDLQYLYYLPFTRVFVSSDKFHHHTVPLFLRDGQFYLDGNDLKGDLQRIIEFYATTQGTTGIPPRVKQPPAIDSSLTWDIWNALSPGHIVPTIDDKDEAYYTRTVRAIRDGTWKPIVRSRPGEPDFMSTSATYGLDDLCPCKNGLFVSNCSCKVANIFRQRLHELGAG
jgi:hypothetical protein